MGMWAFLMLVYFVPFLEKNTLRGWACGQTWSLPCLQEQPLRVQPRARRPHNNRERGGTTWSSQTPRPVGGRAEMRAQAPGSHVLPAPPLTHCLLPHTAFGATSSHGHPYAGVVIGPSLSPPGPVSPAFSFPRSDWGIPQGWAWNSHTLTPTSTPHSAPHRQTQSSIHAPIFAPIS